MKAKKLNKFKKTGEKSAKVKGQKMSKSSSVLTKIKVVGIGGAGGNIVNRMMEGDRIRGVEFIAINTDAQDLDCVSAHKKVYIGRALTRGLGAGMNPEIGRQAVEENRSEIGEILKDADIIFLTAGFGGGTGTGGLPIIADIAREKGILTIAIVTKPFTFEGGQRMNIAQEGLANLKDKVDALVIVPNDRIFSLIDKETPILKAFGYVDDILKNGVKAIADLINMPGIINVDFADIKTIIEDAGPALIGMGLASGQERGIKAVSLAINSPLLEISIDGAKGVLFSIAGGRDLKMSEVHDIAKAISANLDSNSRVIFGAYHDHSLRDKQIKVTVIATGFNGIFSQRFNMPTLFMEKQTLEGEIPVPEESGKKEKKSEAVEEKEIKAPSQLETPEPWEIPAFLRRKKRK